jgi:hypothetical protein
LFGGLKLTEVRKNANYDVYDSVDVKCQSDKSGDDSEEGDDSGNERAYPTEYKTYDCTEKDSDNDPDDKRSNVTLLCLEAERPKLFKQIHNKIPPEFMEYTVYKYYNFFFNKMQ